MRGRQARGAGPVEFQPLLRGVAYRVGRWCPRPVYVWYKSEGPVVRECVGCRVVDHSRVSLSERPTGRATF